MAQSITLSTLIKFLKALETTQKGLAALQEENAQLKAENRAQRATRPAAQPQLKSSVVPDDVTIQCPHGVEIAYEVSHDGKHWVHADTSRGGRHLRLRVTNRAPRPVFVEVAFPVNPRTPNWYRRSHLAPRSNARWAPEEDQELRRLLGRYTKARLSTIAGWKTDKFQRTTAAVVARLNLIKKDLV